MEERAVKMHSLCRLCAREKKEEDLVKSLKDKIDNSRDQDTFQDMIECFGRVKLSRNPDLPQKVCRGCTKAVLTFVEFVAIMEEKQHRLNEKLIQQQATTVKPEPKEPEPKKLKTEKNSPTNNNQKSNVENIEQNTIAPAPSEVTQVNKSKPKRLRRQSIYFQQSIESLMATDKAIGRNFEEIDAIFGKQSKARLDCFEKITIHKSELLPDGEVPREWLEKFEDYKSWEDLSYDCLHCNVKFQGLNAFLIHNEKEVPPKCVTIQCHLCDQSFSSGRFTLGSYVNHLARTHCDYIKFCCIVCSRTFYNIPSLSRHYQQEHANRTMYIYPCLECGLYCQSIMQLKTHKAGHDKQQTKTDD